MGELTDLILNGDLCRECAGALPGNGTGSPRLCLGCTPSSKPSRSARRRAQRRRAQARLKAANPPAQAGN